MDNPYIPKLVRIERVSAETPDIRTLSLEYPPNFTPGQFIQVSSFGIGEAPISISSAPHEKFLQISFKRIGSVTGNLFKLKKNDMIGIRGPLGKGFPIEQLEGKNLILIAGGVGMAPLGSLLKYILNNKGYKSGKVILLYGSRSPQDMLYKGTLKKWGEQIEVLLTVDNPDARWKGRVGVVPQLLNEIAIDPRTTKAVICGPTIMMRFTTAKLLELGMKPSDIIVSLERCMKCGIGKCGHCYIGNKFVCLDGPVFTCDQLDNIVPAEAL